MTEHLCEKLKKIQKRQHVTMTSPEYFPENYELENDSKADSSQKREHPEKTRAIREKNLDKTIADSFPTSDPPSSIPDPSEEEDAA